MSTVVSLCAECPLTMASQLEGCAELIKVLKNGGAHLDFRTRDGITALHKAVRTKNHTALIVSNAHTLVLPTMGGNTWFSYILERDIRGVCVCPDMSHRVAQRWKAFIDTGLYKSLLCFIMIRADLLPEHRTRTQLMCHLKFSWKRHISVVFICQWHIDHNTKDRGYQGSCHNVVSQ